MGSIRSGKSFAITERSSKKSVYVKNVEVENHALNDDFRFNDFFPLCRGRWVFMIFEAGMIEALSHYPNDDMGTYSLICFDG